MSSLPCCILTCKNTLFGSLFLNLNLLRLYCDRGFMPASILWWRKPDRPQLVTSSQSMSDSSSDELSQRVVASEFGCMSDDAMPSKSVPPLSVSSVPLKWCEVFSTRFFQKSRGSRGSLACISVWAGYRPVLKRSISPVLFLMQLRDIDINSDSLS